MITSEQEYGAAIIAKGGTVQDAVTALNLCTHNMWSSVVEIVLREGRGVWLKHPTVYGFNEGPRASEFEGQNGFYWHGTYLPLRSA